MIISLEYFCLWVGGCRGKAASKEKCPVWCLLPSLTIGSIGPCPTDIFTENPWSRGEALLLPLSQPQGLQSRG